MFNDNHSEKTAKGKCTTPKVVQTSELIECSENIVQLFNLILKSNPTEKF